MVYPHLLSFLYLTHREIQNEIKSRSKYNILVETVDD